MPRTIPELYAWHTKAQILLPSDVQRNFECWLAEDSFSGDSQAYGKGQEMLTYLESQDRLGRVEHRQALASLSPYQVRREYGLETLMWIEAGLRVAVPMFDKERAEILESQGINTKDLEGARNFALKRLGHDEFATILAQYQMTRRLEEDVLETIDLPELLRSAAIPLKGLSAKRVSDYSLRSFEAERPFTDQGAMAKELYTPSPCTPHQAQDRYYQLWLDTPSAVGLWYKGEPIVVAGLAATSSDTLMIQQLQPIYAKRGWAGDEKKLRPRGLMPIAWPQIMVGAAEEIARKLGFVHVAIQGGKNNMWVGQGHMTLAEAEQRYDAVADRLWYARHIHDGNWYTRVRSTPVNSAPEQV